MSAIEAIIDDVLYPTENIDRVTWHYAREIGLEVTRASLRKTVEGHPDYPSLLALSDALESFGAETVAARLNEKQLRELGQPYITQIRLNNGGAQVFTVVRPEKQAQLSYLHPERDQWILTTIDEFIDLFRGVVLVAVGREGFGEPDYRKKKKTARRGSTIRKAVFAIIPVFVFSTVALGLWQYGVAAIFPTAYLLLALVGTILGMLLLLFEINRHNPALKQICSGSKNLSCGAVLDSAVSKIFGVSWSLIGFAYFAGTLIALLITGLTTPPLLHLLSWLSRLALGYTIFSLYYQWRVAKQWCTLCLATQGVLMAQAALVLIFGQSFVADAQLSITSVLTLVICFTLPFLGGLLIIPILKRAKDGENHRRELTKIKRNDQIFRSLLEKQRSVTEDDNGLGITLGRPDAKHRIIKVCNPYCGPCAKAHPLIEEILRINPDVQVRIIFTAMDDDKDIRAAPVHHLLEIFQQGDEQTLKRALNDWYSPKKKDYAVFAAKYPMNGALQSRGNDIKAMRKWCEKMEIHFTPTFFVDGYQLPSMYTPADLKYFLKPA
ncbi:vitamin K epoxide reductase family protein [Parapedobacter sp.]